MRIDKAKLAYELAKREWRYKRLAECSKLSRATVSAIAGGKAIHPDTAQKIANALGISVDELIETEAKQ